MSDTLSSLFPRYMHFDPLVPVWNVTPRMDRVIHRFFDTSPFSPSGRYLGLTRLPFEDRLPKPGDVAEIVVVDLETGEARVVAETRGWDTQLGAQVQWGADDAQMFFNDMDVKTWTPFGVVLDPATGRRRNLEGTVYVVSRDGRWAASPCLLRIGATQAGYGVIAPRDFVPVNRGASDEDGLFVTDVASGKSRLLVSFKRILEEATPRMNPEEFKDGDFYGFHVKWNLKSDRLMFVVRWLRRESSQKYRAQVITLKPDGSDIRVAIPFSEWDKGGHHPDWEPDGDTVMMNLKLDGKTLCFVKARYDGSVLATMTEAVVGSGHPTLHPNGRHIVTDAYTTEVVTAGDGTVPIRLIDLTAGAERTLVRIRTEPEWRGPKNELRVDPHPAWDRAFRRIAFNAYPDGTRRVFVADLSEILGL